MEEASRLHAVSSAFPNGPKGQNEAPPVCWLAVKLGRSFFSSGAAWVALNKEYCVSNVFFIFLLALIGLLLTGEIGSSIFWHCLSACEQVELGRQGIRMHHLRPSPLAYQ